MTQPNDRTHVLKMTAAVRPVARAQVGGFFVWMSGIPINEFGGSPLGPYFPTILAARGSVGRTPAVWDFNLRFAYDVGARSFRQGRVVLDLLHAGNPRQTTQVDEQRYFALDKSGQQSNANPNYLKPTAYQPPMMARIGFEVDF